MQLVSEAALRLHPSEVREIDIGGVRCHLVRPKDIEPDGRVLLNLHADGFVFGSGSLGEAIPIAARTGATVLAVDYRLAPEHAHPAAVDDVVTVWRHVLEHHDAASTAIFGTSAGAFLTAQTVMRLLDEGLQATDFHTVLVHSAINACRSG